MHLRFLDIVFLVYEGWSAEHKKFVPYINGKRTKTDFLSRYFHPGVDVRANGAGLSLCIEEPYGTGPKGALNV